MKSIIIIVLNKENQPMKRVPLQRKVVTNPGIVSCKKKKQASEKQTGNQLPGLMKEKPNPDFFL